MKTKVLLASAVFLAACQGQSNKETLTPDTVPVRVALPAVHAALSAEASQLSLLQDTTKYSYLPFHLVIRATNASGFNQSVVVKPDAPEAVLQLPTGPVKIEALVFGMPIPEGMTRTQMCSRGDRSETDQPPSSENTWQPPKNYPGGAMLRAFGAPVFEGENPPPSGSDGSDGGKGEGGLKFLFVSQLSQNVDVQAGTDVLPVSLPALRIAKMENLGVRVTDAGKPVANAKFPLVDTLSYRPILDPCDGTAVDIRTDARGRMVDSLPEVGGGVPLFAVALPRGGFATIDVNTSSALGRFQELKLDTGTVTPLPGSFDFFGVGASLDAVASKGLAYINSLLEALRHSLDNTDGSQAGTEGFWAPGLPLPAPKTFVMQFGDTLVVQPQGILRCGATVGFDPYRSDARLEAQFRWTFKGTAADAMKNADGQVFPDAFLVPNSAVLGDVVSCQARVVELDSAGALKGTPSPWSEARVSVNSSEPAPVGGMGPGPDGSGTGGANAGPSGFWMPDPEGTEVLTFHQNTALVRLNIAAHWPGEIDGFSYVLANAGTNPASCPLTPHALRLTEQNTYGIVLSNLSASTSYTLRVCTTGEKDGIRRASFGRVVSFQTPASSSGVGANDFDASIPTPDFFAAFASNYDRVSFHFNTVSGATGYQVFFSNSPEVPLHSPVLSLSATDTVTWTHTGLQEGQEFFYRIAAISNVGSMAKKSVPSEVRRVRVTGFHTSPLSFSPSAPASFAIQDLHGDAHGHHLIAATMRGVSVRHSDGKWNHSTTTHGLLSSRVARVRMRFTAFQPAFCAVHQGGGVSYSFNGGANWFTLPPGGTPSTAAATSCDFFNGDLYVGRSSGPLLRVPQFGAPHEIAGSPSANGLAADHSGLVVAGPNGLYASQSGGTFASIDSGAWTRVQAVDGRLLAAKADGTVALRTSPQASLTSLGTLFGSSVEGLHLYYGANGESHFAVLAGGIVRTLLASNPSPGSLGSWTNRGQPSNVSGIAGNGLAGTDTQFAVARALQGIFVGVDTTWSQETQPAHAKSVASGFETGFYDPVLQRPVGPQAYATSGNNSVQFLDPAGFWATSFSTGNASDVVHQLFFHNPLNSEATSTVFAATSAGLFRKGGTGMWSQVYASGAVTGVGVMPQGISNSSPLFVAAAASVLKQSVDGINWGTFTPAMGSSCEANLAGPFTAMATGENFTALARSADVVVLFKTGLLLNDIGCAVFASGDLGFTGIMVTDLAAVGNGTTGVIVGRAANNTWFVIRNPAATSPATPTTSTGPATNILAAASGLGGVVRFSHSGIAIAVNDQFGVGRLYTLTSSNAWQPSNAHLSLPQWPISKLFTAWQHGGLSIRYGNATDANSGLGGVFQGNMPDTSALP